MFSRALNDVFVSVLRVLMGLLVHSQFSRSHQIRVRFSLRLLCFCRYCLFTERYFTRCLV